jgi:seryl-tRNA synthetase
LITESFIDKIKDKLLYEKFLEKSNIEKETIQEMKELKNALENIKEDNTQETKLKEIENTFLDNPSEDIDNQNNEKQQEEIEKTEDKPEDISGNFDALPENYKNYITKISSKFPDPKKTQIRKF